jgi:hypothetical protein
MLAASKFCDLIKNRGWITVTFNENFKYLALVRSQQFTNGLAPFHLLTIKIRWTAPRWRWAMFGVGPAAWRWSAGTHR